MTWEKIETAPKDGTDILVYEPESTELFVAFFQDGVWVYAHDDEGAALYVKPTHWQPLPKPPSSKRDI